MAKGNNQKLKMLYLAKIFAQETDDEHALTLAQITELLNRYEVNADRKTLYLDFEELRHFGMDIIAEQRGRNTYYHLGDRDFELPELKLLVDLVESARFITVRKSRSLIRKLEGLVSRHQAQKLQRQVTISGRIKTMNESIYYSVDRLHEAINSDSQIRFQYFQWNVKKETELRRGGAWYVVSPWSLTWDNQNYYLIAFDAADGKIKHYRVDKMLHIQPTKGPRLGRAQFQELDPAKYAQSLFGMLHGEETAVTLRAENRMAGILIDRFGKDILLTPVDGDHFEALVRVAVSQQFFGWLLGLGDGIRLTGPGPVVDQLKEELSNLGRLYGTLPDGAETAD